jgi:WD40 repeat protein
VIITAAVDLNENVLDDLPGRVFQRLPDDRYEIFLREAGERELRPIMEVIIQDGRPAMVNAGGSIQGESSMNCVAFNASGEMALAVDSVNQRIHLWKFVGDNAAIEKLPELVFGDGLSSAIFAPSPRGPGLLVMGGSNVQLVSLTTRETLERYAPHGSVNSATFSPDGSRIVTGSRDRIARIWDIESGADLRKFSGENGHTDSVNSSVFSPDADGKHILTASDDGTVKLWDAATGDVVGTFNGHAGAVNSAVFSPDGSLMLSASSDGTARLWDTESGEELVRYEGHAEAVLAARFSDDAKYIVTAGADDTARVWNRETGEPLLAGDADHPGVLSGHTARVTSAAFSPGNNPSRVVTASGDGTVKLWDLNSQKEILTLDGHTREVTSVSFSPDGSSVLTSSEDGRAILWLTTDWTSGRPARQVATTRGVVRTPVVRPRQSTRPPPDPPGPRRPPVDNQPRQTKEEPKGPPSNVTAAPETAPATPRPVINPAESSPGPYREVLPQHSNSVATSFPGLEHEYGKLTAAGKPRLVQWDRDARLLIETARAQVASDLMRGVCL